MPHIRNLRFTSVQCRHCGCRLPMEWEVALLEAIIPRFINGRVDLEQRWLNETGVPVVPDAVFSSTEIEHMIEGMDELTDEEMDWLETSGDFLPMQDCWQEIVSNLDDLIPDELPTDHPLACDFCKQDLTFNEPAIRVRHCTIVPNPRGHNESKLEPCPGYSDMVMCLSCAYTMSKEIIPVDENGQDLWPTL